MPKKLQVILIAILAIIIGLVLGYFFGYDIGYEKAAKDQQTAPEATINSYEDCVKAGYPTMQTQSFPPVNHCQTPDGKSFRQ